MGYIHPCKETFKFAFTSILYLTKKLTLFSYRNPLNSDKEAIDVSWRESPFLRPALTAAGFNGTYDIRTKSYTFLPCPVGTFSNFSSKRAEGCVQCPPGIL